MWSSGGDSSKLFLFIYLFLIIEKNLKYLQIHLKIFCYYGHCDYDYYKLVNVFNTDHDRLPKIRKSIYVMKHT